MENAALNCKYAADIVGYLYDEIPAVDRVRFEDHLADCASCIDEFAAVSDVRFGVYEWHREEFVPLATPVIKIPELAANEGWFAGLAASVRSALAFPAGPALAFGALLITVLAGLAGWKALQPGEVQIAANDLRPEQPQRTSIAPPAPEIADDELANEVRSVDKVGSLPSVTPMPVVKASARVSRPAVRHAVATKAPTPLPSVQAKDRGVDPRLDDSARDDDNSLRLSDLFAEVGTR